MNDRSISIKRFSKKATGSLALRVLYLSMGLIVFPLIIHTIFLYKHEYNQRLNDSFDNLQFLIEDRKDYFNLLIKSHLDLLETLIPNLPMTPEARNAFLENEVKELSVDKLLYLELDEQGGCSDPLCQDPLFLKEIASSQTIFYVNQDWVLIGKTVPSMGKPKGLFMTANKSSSLFSRLSQRSLPVNTVLVGPTGTVGYTTDPKWTGPPYEAKQLWNTGPHPGWLVKTPEGPMLIVKTPILGTDWNLLMMLSANRLNDLQLKNYVIEVGTFLALVILIGGGALLLLTRRISKPLKSLIQTMDRVTEGAKHCRYQSDPMGFEINVLGLQMNQMIDSLLEHQDKAEKERIIRERLAQELLIGHQIQSSMLTSNPPQTNLQIAPGYLAAREVSGDFYDLFLLPDGRLLLTIADAADKGISACLYGLSLRSMLRTAATTQKDLVSIVATANRMLCQDTAASSFFITAWIGIYDPNTEELSYCSHGHPPAYLRTKNKELVELSTHGLALGIDPHLQPTMGRVSWTGHDLLLLYTDGITEAHDSDFELFGKARLEDFLRRCNALSAQDVVDQLIEEIHLFSRGAPQSDDLTLVAICP